MLELVLRITFATSGFQEFLSKTACTLMKKVHSARIASHLIKRTFIRINTNFYLDTE